MRGPAAVRPRVAPSRMGSSESQRAAPRQANPRGGRRSVRRPSASFSMAPTAPTRIPCRDGDRGGSRRTQCRHRVRRRRWILAPPPRRLQSLIIHGGGAPDIHVSLVAGVLAPWACVVRPGLMHQSEPDLSCEAETCHGDPSSGELVGDAGN
jgi:hypothetical protein